MPGTLYCHILEVMNRRLFENWSTQLRKGMLELCILNDIRNRQMYGYEIVRRLRKIEGLIISEGTIYPILSRLKRQGLIKTYMQESPEGAPRKYYELTQQGKKLTAQMNAYWQAIRNETDSIEKGRR